VVQRLAQRVNRADHLFLWGMQKAALGIGKSGCAGGGQGPAEHAGPRLVVPVSTGLMGSSDGCASGRALAYPGTPRKTLPVVRV
jgi:hypothetical protein